MYPQIELGVSLQDRYEVVDRIGNGAMGAVYKAHDKRLDVLVALKQSIIVGGEASDAFYAEARRLASLKYDTFPKVTDFFIDEKYGYLLVMEYVPGDDLSKVLESQHRPSTEQIVRWFEQLLEALHYLHTQEPPIIHKDIKPANIKRTPQDKVLLLDFGLSKGGIVPAEEEEKSLLGYTPAFAPLEQRNRKGTDAQSDLYSLCATFYYLLSWQRPKNARLRDECVQAKQPDPLQPLSELNPELRPVIASLVMEGLQLERDKRPASAMAMLSALRRAYAGVADAPSPPQDSEETRPPTPPRPPGPIGHHPRRSTANAPTRSQATLRVDASGRRGFRTIAHALQVAQKGDRIEIAEGEYREALKVNQAIQLVGIGDRDQTHIMVQGNRLFSMEIASPEVVISGLTVYGLLTNIKSQLEIRDCVIFDADLCHGKSVIERSSLVGRTTNRGVLVLRNSRLIAEEDPVCFENGGSIQADKCQFRGNTILEHGTVDIRESQLEGETEIGPGTNVYLTTTTLIQKTINWGTTTLETCKIETHALTAIEHHSGVLTLKNRCHVVGDVHLTGGDAAIRHSSIQGTLSNQGALILESTDIDSASDHIALYSQGKLEATECQITGKVHFESENITLEHVVVRGQIVNKGILSLISSRIFSGEMGTALYNEGSLIARWSDIKGGEVGYRASGQAHSDLFKCLISEGRLLGIEVATQPTIEMIMERCIVQRNGIGLLLRPHARAYLITCEINSNQDVGVLAEEESVLTIKNATISDNGGSGVALADVSVTANISSSSITRNGNVGIEALNGGRGLIRGNDLHQNARASADGPEPWLTSLRRNKNRIEPHHRSH